jgi:hypothetical protein
MHSPRRLVKKPPVYAPKPPGGIMVMVSTRWKNIGWQGGISMSAGKNKALVRRFLKAHAKGDIDTLEEMLAPTSSTTI